jgi:hypothetical protein
MIAILIQHTADDPSKWTVRQNLEIAKEATARAIRYETTYAHLSHAASTAAHQRSVASHAMRRARSILAARYPHEDNDQIDRHDPTHTWVRRILADVSGDEVRSHDLDALLVADLGIDPWSDGDEIADAVEDWTGAVLGANCPLRNPLRCNALRVRDVIDMALLPAFDPVRPPTPPDNRRTKETSKCQKNSLTIKP